MKQKLSVLCSFEPDLNPKVRFEYTTVANFFDITVFGIYDSRFPRRDEFPTPFVQVKRLKKRLSKEIIMGYLRFVSHVRKPFGIWFVFPMFFLGLLAAPLIVLYGFIKFFKMSCDILLRTVKKNKQFKEFLLKRELIIFTWSKIQNVKAFFKTCKNGLYKKSLQYTLFGNYIFHLFSLVSTQLAALYVNPEKTDIIYCSDLDGLITGAIYKFEKDCRLVYNADNFWPKDNISYSRQDGFFFLVLKNTLKCAVDVVVTSDPLLANEIRKTYKVAVIESLPKMHDEFQVLKK